MCRPSPAAVAERADDDFWLMLLLSLAAVPLILLLRGPKKNTHPKTDEVGGCSP